MQYQRMKSQSIKTKKVKTVVDVCFFSIVIDRPTKRLMQKCRVIALLIATKIN